MVQINSNILEQLSDNVIHKKLVLDVCLYMAKYLISVNRDDDAIELMKRAANHDNSKFEKEELLSLTSIVNNKESLKNPNVTMSDEVKKVIEKHWKKNRHHPEHFVSPSNMGEIDIIEMVCDQYARTLQFKNDYMEYIKIKQENRFHFDQEIFEKVLFYANILKNYHI